MKILLKLFLTLVAVAICSLLDQSFVAYHTFWLWLSVGAVVSIWKWDFSFTLYGIGVGLSHVLIVRYGYSVLWVPAVLVVVAVVRSYLKNKTVNQDESGSVDGIEADHSDEQYYMMAAEEFGLDNINKGLFVKAEVEADGDPDKTRLIYIQARVVQLKSEGLVSGRHRQRVQATPWRIVCTSYILLAAGAIVALILFGIFGDALKMKHEKIVGDPEQMEPASTALPVIEALPSEQKSVSRVQYSKEDLLDSGSKEESLSEEGPLQISEQVLEGMGQDSLKRAEKGDAKSQWGTGLGYLEGFLGHEQDAQEAVKWFTKSAVQGYAPAQCSLGGCYYRGDGVTRNYANAAKWFKASAKQGSETAQYMVGLLYYLGEGVPQNSEKAFRCFKMSAIQGYADAQTALALRYDAGEGVAQNSYEAVKWYRKSAIQGNGISQLQLAVHYYDGDGVIQDFVEGYAWAVNAANNPQSSEMGMGLKEALYNDLTPEQVYRGQIRAKELSNEIEAAKPKRPIRYKIVPKPVG